MCRPVPIRLNFPAAMALYAIASSYSAAAESAKLESTEADFYVSSAGQDAWSGKLAEPNAERTDGPFATLGRAQAAVRQTLKTAGEIKKPLTVLLRAGVYRLAAPVEFGPDDSGSANFSITYAAYPGESPVLSGGLPVTGWEKWQGETWRAASPTGRGVQQLYCAGQAQVRARYPNLDPDDPIAKGWLYIRDVPGTDRGSRAPLARQGFYYHEGELPEWTDLTGAEVSAYSWTNYSHDVSPLVGIDREKCLVTLDRKTGLAFKPHNRYFFQNLLAALDQPGEYYSNPKSGEIFYWPRRPEDLQALIVPSASVLLTVKGDAAGGRPVRNLHFRGLTFSEATQDGVKLSGIAQCSVRGCLFINLGGTGLTVNGAAEENLLADNELAYIGGPGISIDGCPPGTPDRCTRNVIRNNHVHHCGLVQKSASGIVFNNASHTRVENNLVHDLPYAGIFWGGGAMLKYYTESGKQPWAYASNQINGIVVTRENIKTFFNSHDNLIQRNHVYNCCLEACDGGAIYCWAPGINNTVCQNLVHDVIGFSASGPEEFHFLAMGIYLDDESDATTVEGNVVFRISNYGVFIHNGIDNRVYRNLVADCGNSLIAFLNETKRPGENVVEGNLAVCPDWPVDLVSISPNLPDHVQANHNFYFSGSTPPSFRCQGRHDFAEWQAVGQDAESQVVDPRFADPARGDFSLAADSPVRQSGWSGLDLSTVGLLPDWGTRPETPAGRAARLAGPQSPPFFSREILKQRALSGGANPRAPRHAVATRLETAPVIDGDLTDWPEAAWATALQLRQTPTGQATESTALAAVARDAENLYVAVQADLADPTLLESDPARAVWGQTYGAEVCLGIDRFTTHVLHGFASGHHELSAEAGATPERMQALEGQYQYAARVKDRRWFGEWRIPLKAAGLDPHSPRQIRFNLGLFDRARSEWTAWVGTQGPNWQVENAGLLTLNPAVPAAAPNLIRNPTCEAHPSPEPWYEDGWDTGPAAPEKKALVVMANEGRDGSSCLKLVGRDATAMTKILAVWRQKVLNPRPGIYRLSYWVKTAQLSAATLDAGFGAYAYLCGPDGKNGEYLGREDGWIENSDLPWERREILLNVSPGFTELWISFGLRQTVGTVWIDDVILQECQ